MTARADYDILIRGGLVYDGRGGAPIEAEVAIAGDRLAHVGPLPGARGRVELDARGLAVAPGFINMLSWATESLIADGRSLSDLRQGVTLEVMGEGWSMGPLTDDMRRAALEHQGDIRYPIEWTTLGGYLEWLARRGVATNVASFVGASTVRIHVVGYDDRRATPAELNAMSNLVAQAMGEGALGVASALIYVPGCFADTGELSTLARAAAEHGGLYISHLRSEGERLLEAVDEHIAIARAAGARSEIYHFKAIGAANWPKLGGAIERVEAARAAGLAITADMYPYTASSTGLDAAMPPWVQAGGHTAWMARLRDPEMRARVEREIATPNRDWENVYLLAGSPEKVLLVNFRNERLKPLTGQTLAAVAAQRGQSPEAAIVDLVLEDDSRVGAVYFVMAEDNVRRVLRLPWVSFGSDAGSLAPEGVFLNAGTHPRAYGTFARLLGYYVREERLLPLEAAIHRLTALPAANLRLDRRGALVPGHFADVVVFDPATVQDHATYDRPHQLATGVRHVVVNGVLALRDEQPTGALPGRVVRGPGWKGA